MTANPTLVRKSLGILSMLFGTVWCSVVIHPLPGQLHGASFRGASGYIAVAGMVPLMILPGALALMAGASLYRALDQWMVKFIVGVFCALGAVGIALLLASVFPHPLAGQIRHSLYPFVGTLLVIPAYVMVVRKIFAILGQAKPKLQDLVGKGTFILIAWQLCFLIFSVFDEYAPFEDGRHIHEEPWDILSFVVPIIVSYGAYRIAVALLPANNPKPDAAPGSRR